MGKEEILARSIAVFGNVNSGKSTTRMEKLCAIFVSGILVPLFGSRVFVSILSYKDLNISCKPVISSLDKFSATIWLKRKKLDLSVNETKVRQAR